jgi:hypothetical protein
MKKVLALSLPVLFLAAACGRTGTQAPAWQTVKADDNSYTVSMPAQPTPTNQSVDVPQGKIIIHMQTLDSGNINYTAGYSQYPANFLASMGAGPDEIFDKARDATVKQKNAKLSEDKKGTTSGFPSRTITMQFALPNNAGEAKLQQILILAKERMYIIQTLSPATAPKNADQDISRFQQSFVLNVK